MLVGTILWMVELPFFLVILPIYALQTVLTAKEYIIARKGFPKDSYKPIPISTLVFVCLTMGTLFRIISSIIVGVLDSPEPYSNPWLHSSLMLCITCYLLEWYFVVYFWVGIIVGFLMSNKNSNSSGVETITSGQGGGSLVNNNRPLWICEIILWIGVTVTILIHITLVFCDFYERKEINVDIWWRIIFSVFGIISLLIFIPYSSILLRHYSKDVEFDTIIKRKLVWFMTIYTISFATSFILNLFYLCYVRERGGYWNYISNILYFVVEWTHGVLITILLGKCRFTLSISRFFNAPRFSSEFNSHHSLLTDNINNQHHQQQPYQQLPQHSPPPSPSLLSMASHSLTLSNNNLPNLTLLTTNNNNTNSAMISLSKTKSTNQNQKKPKTKKEGNSNKVYQLITDEEDMEQQQQVNVDIQKQQFIQEYLSKQQQQQQQYQPYHQQQQHQYHNNNRYNNHNGHQYQQYDDEDYYPNNMTMSTDHNTLFNVDDITQNENEDTFSFDHY